MYRMMGVSSLFIISLTACGSPRTSAPSERETFPPAQAVRSHVPSTISSQPLASPEPTRVPGVIEFFNEDTTNVVQVPEDVATNTPFDVTIVTFGDGCDSVGDAQVTMTGNTADITVYDYRTLGVACIQPLNRFPRTVTLQFPLAGNGVVRVHGQRIGPETNGYPGTETMLERQVNVQ